MAHVAEIGSRIELVSMDGDFHDISIALYRQDSRWGPKFVVHSYSPREGTADRLAEIGHNMVVLGGMDRGSDDPRTVWFPCHSEHGLACKRVFLEACKPLSSLQPKPLEIFDKKSELIIVVTSLGGGAYHVRGDGEYDAKERRVSTITGGLIKLGELISVLDTTDQVRFPCGQSHDSLIGLLLVRALNVRAVIREQESASAQGILSAPSQQN